VGVEVVRGKYIFLGLSFISMDMVIISIRCVEKVVTTFFLSTLWRESHSYSPMANVGPWSLEGNIIPFEREGCIYVEDFGIMNRSNMFYLELEGNSTYSSSLILQGEFTMFEMVHKHLYQHLSTIPLFLTTTSMVYLHLVTLDTSLDTWMILSQFLGTYIHILESSSDTFSF